MRNIKLLIEYDGADFIGWQWQPKGRSVEGALRRALQQLLQEQPKILGAGRTDSGVHALGQVANFKTGSELKLEQIRDGLNYYLPRDIRILATDEVADEFHARRSAKSRRYRYAISRYQPAIGRQYVWFYKHDVDLDAMNRAAAFMLGNHSFRAFSRPNPDELHYRCHVQEAAWQEQASRLVFDIRANRFLHHMVRIIVGTLLDIGRGKNKPEVILRMLREEDKEFAGVVVPPKGLFLVKVEY